MKIEDQIKRTVEERVAQRPPYDGAYVRVLLRHRRQQRVRVAAGVIGAAAAVVAAVLVVPQLGTNSATRPPFTSKPPAVVTTPTVAQTTRVTPPAGTDCAPDCRLVQRSNFASPVANATGVAFDGKSLWIMAGGDTGSHSLTEVDPVSGATGRRYMLGDLAETAGTWAYGVASDGRYAWISVTGNTNKIVRVDLQDGTIVGSYSSPTTLGEGPSDLEFDGKDLWLSSGAGNIYRIDPARGSILQSLRSWPSHARDHGIALREGELWVGSLFEDGVAIQDPETGEVLDRVGDEEGRTIKREWGPMTFADGQLVLLDRFGITFYDVESR